jgi:hypothetical protein
VRANLGRRLPGRSAHRQDQDDDEDDEEDDEIRTRDDLADPHSFRSLRGDSSSSNSSSNNNSDNESDGSDQEDLDLSALPEPVRRQLTRGSDSDDDSDEDGPLDDDEDRLLTGGLGSSRSRSARRGATDGGDVDPDEEAVSEQWGQRKKTYYARPGEVVSSDEEGIQQEASEARSVGAYAHLHSFASHPH